MDIRLEARRLIDALPEDSVRIIVEVMSRMKTEEEENRKISERDTYKNVARKLAVQDIDVYSRQIFEETYTRTQTKHIKAVMEGLRISAERAMDVLDIPEEERQRYEAALVDVDAK